MTNKSAGLFLITGVGLTTLGALLFLSLPLDTIGLTAPAASLLGESPYLYYLAATAGCGLMAWGAVLLWGAQSPAELRRRIAMGSGIGFLALSLMRVFAALAQGVSAFEPLRTLMALEAIAFFGLSMFFFQLGCQLFQRLADTWRSLLAAKAWVLVWIFVFLAPVNIASYFVYFSTQHPIAGWTAIAFTVVLLTNLPLGLWERGVSKATSIPHLFPWIPLQIYLGILLFDSAPAPAGLVGYYAWAVFIINGVSIAFDLLDSYRWLAGDRDVLGATASVTS